MVGRAGRVHASRWRGLVTRLEANKIAARLAAASQLFPLPHSPVGGKAVRDSTVVVEADGAAIAATVTDYDGRKREYRAVVQLVSDSHSQEMRGAPAVTEAPLSELTHHSHSERKF